MTDTRIKIPAELFALAESSSFEGLYQPDLLSIGPDQYSFSEPLIWKLTVTNTGSAFLVDGSIEGQGVCPCARCLEDVGHSFSGHIEGYYLIEGSSTDVDDFDDDEALEDEFDILPADHCIDIKPLLDAALYIDAPDVPLCTPDCKGLCHQCGANLNEGSCDCGPDEELEAFNAQANPFSILANFSFDD